MLVHKQTYFKVMYIYIYEFMNNYVALISFNAYFHTCIHTHIHAYICRNIINIALIFNNFPPCIPTFSPHAMNANALQ